MKYITIIFLFFSFSTLGQETENKKVNLELSLGENRLFKQNQTIGKYPYSYNRKGGWETNASIIIGLSLKNWRITLSQSVGTIKLNNEYRIFDFDTVMSKANIRFRTMHIYTGVNVGRKFNLSENSSVELGLGMQYSFFTTSTQTFEVFENQNAPPLDLTYVEISTVKSKTALNNLTPIIYIKWNQKIKTQWFGLSLIYGERGISYDSYWHTNKRFSLQLDQPASIYKYIGLQLSYTLPFNNQR